MHDHSTGPAPPSHASCSSGWENLCLDNIDGHWWGIAIEIVTLIYAFIGVAIVADRHLVVSLETLCVRWDVREDVAGASFMAFGSAAPEIVINAISTMKTVLSNAPTKHGRVQEGDGGDDAALGVGAILGSGMIAFTAIPGICGIFAGGEEPLELKRRPLARDVLAYSIALFWLCCIFHDGVIETHESGAMLVGYAAYMLVVVFAAGMREHYRVKFLKKDVRLGESFVLASSRAVSSAPALSTDGSAGPDAESGRLTANNGSYAAPSPPRSNSSGSEANVTPLAEATKLLEARSLLSVAELPEGTPWTPFSPSQAPDGAYQTPQQMLLSDGAKSTRFAQPEKALPPSAAAGCLSALGAVGGALIAPLEWAITLTCPECEHDGAHAGWYPVTLASAFFWVAALSLVISAVVSRLGSLLNVPAAFLGMYIIAIGAEIPDTIQSVTVAKRGYGSMAVSNSCGSQIINILVGLGMPWFMSNWSGVPIIIRDHEDLLLMAYFQCFIMFAFTSLLLVTTAHTWLPGDHRKATLGPTKGALLVGVYVLCLAGYPIAHLVYNKETRIDRAGDEP